MELDTLGDRKTALFVIISDTDDTFNFVVSILYTQLFNLLCDKADDVYGGRLPVHVRCLLDEFANIGQIPKFEKLIATIRSREISASIILQSQSQLKAIYKDNADTIVGNCDTTLFLGGKEKTTLKEISEILGKETIDSFNTSETRGRELSHGLNYQKLGKELMTQDEIAVMDGGKCILQLRGVRPFFSDKYDITKHPKYKYLSDADQKNAFDMEKHLKRRPAIVKPDEVFDYYEIDVQEDAALLLWIGFPLPHRPWSSSEPPSPGLFAGLWLFTCLPVRALVAALPSLNFGNVVENRIRLGWADGVAQGFQPQYPVLHALGHTGDSLRLFGPEDTSVHPRGKPMSHSTQSGFRAASGLALGVR